MSYKGRTIGEIYKGNKMPGIDDTYVSPAEWEMIKALRQEKEIIVNEQNEKSSNQKAVEIVNKLSDYFNCMPGAIESNILTLASTAGMNKYQNKAAETAIYPGKGTPLGLIYCALKLSGEAGEVSENVGKALRDDGLWYEDAHDAGFCSITKERVNKIVLELGDVLWYVSQVAKELGFTLEEIAQTNLDKLSARAKNGTLKGSGDDR